MSEQRTRRKSGLWLRPRGDKFEAVDIIEGNVLGIFDSLQAAVDALYGEGASVEYRDGESKYCSDDPMTDDGYALRESPA